MADENLIRAVRVVYRRCNPDTTAEQALEWLLDELCEPLTPSQPEQVHGQVGVISERLRAVLNEGAL